jgi:hypothetical protein
MDIELLFSTSPFVQQKLGQFAYIKPNLVSDSLSFFFASSFAVFILLQTVSVALPAGNNTFKTPLPSVYSNANVMINVVEGGISKSKVRFPYQGRLFAPFYIFSLVSLSLSSHIILTIWP